MRALQFKYARRRFSATRDEQGVPHVEADSWREALYGLGYLHALDRPTQMLFSRAIAAGRGAELIADRPEMIESDRFFRRAGLELHLVDEVGRLDDLTFGHITAYCEGVNDGMRQAGRTLPMWATGFHPSPWDQRSVLLIGKLLSFGGLAVGQQQNERLILELIQAGVDDDRLRELFSPLLDEADFDLLRKVRISNQLSDDTLELMTDLPRLAGSNAWAVSPWRSATGTALLASDPHLEVNRLPAIWYEAVLHWGDQYVLGATLPGCPLYAVGRTPHVAWGVTYIKADTSDFFIEECKPGGATGWQYRRGQQWLDFEVRSELLQRKGGAAELVRIYHNPVGTLQVDPDEHPAAVDIAVTNGHAHEASKYFLSVAWIGQRAGVGRAISIWLDLVASRTALEAMDLVRDCPQPTLCWVVADREGHIGLQGCGWIPRRATHHSGLLPIPAWDERNHWQGVLSPGVLPRVYDPPEGFVASANQSINETGGPRLVTMPVPDYRWRRIVERLGQLPHATLEDMRSLQYDVVSLQARDLLQVFLPHLPDGSIKERLSHWDFSYPPDSHAATLFSRLYRHVLLEVFGQAPHRAGGGIGFRRMLYLSSRCGYSVMVLTAIDRLLHQEHSLWWASRDKGELIRRAAQRAQAEEDVPWSEINSFQFRNRFIASERVGRALGFHLPRMAMPGCHATLFQGHLLTTARRESTFAPSYHFVTDLGRDEAWTNLPGGPSESRFSPYYRNDIPRWQSGEYKRLAAFSQFEPRQPPS